VSCVRSNAAGLDLDVRRFFDNSSEKVSLEIGARVRR